MSMEHSTTKTTKRAELGLRKLDLFRHFEYRPHETQLLVHRSKAKRRVVACGVRWGKSTVGVHEAIAELLWPRDQALGWLVAPTYEVTKRIAERVVATLQQHMPHRIVKLDAQERSITVANLGGGLSVLRARSADRPVGLLGESLDFLVVDEAAQIDERVWTEHLAPRLLDRNGNALILSTPDGGGWFHEEYRRAKSEPETYASWAFPTSDNPRIDKGLIEAERKRLPQEVWEAQYGARFIGVPIEPCAQCGGPSLSAPTFVMLVGEEKLGTCAACGREVDEDGDSVVPLNRDGREGSLRIIHITPGMGAMEPPEMP